MAVTGVLSGGRRGRFRTLLGGRRAHCAYAGTSSSLAMRTRL